ncbi:MAG: carbohydrate-binding protein [Lachnospiraceae bacterium]|nr:carbohydrate-binding protein [Lachnospiraceae bacterium]
MNCKIEIRDNSGVVRACAEGERRADLVFDGEYASGDRIAVSLSEYPAYIVLQLDDALGSSVNYITGPFELEIPFAEKKTSYSPKTFAGNRHYLYVRKAFRYEYAAYRNLALNVNDCHENATLFPHAHANVETRGEAVFAARNAIDGVCVNYSHGEWPFESWGINRRDDAKMTVEFGKTVEVDRIVLYTRADFPHDNWWESVTFTFSDGEKLVTGLHKSSAPHEIIIKAKKTNSITLSELIKADDPSPFPALTQIEVYGMYVKD